MAQSQDELQQLMRNRGEYYFTLSVDDSSQIQELSRICSVDGTDGRNVVAYANQQEYDFAACQCHYVERTRHL